MSGVKQLLLGKERDLSLTVTMLFSSDGRTLFLLASEQDGRVWKGTEHSAWMCTVQFETAVLLPHVESE